MTALTDMQGTVLGPLTTAWSMPDSCTVHVVNCPTCAEGFRGQQCAQDGRAVDHTSCWPPVTAQAGTPQHPFYGWGFYSPGLACPTGYTAACTAVYGGRPAWEFQFNLVPGETAIGCCPDGFRCINRLGNSCIAIASTDAQIAVATGVCSGSAIAGVGQGNFPDIVTATITDTSNAAGPFGAVQTVTREMVLLAPMFQLNYKSSDLVSESTSASTTVTPITPVTTPPGLTPTASTGSDPNDNLNSPSDDSSTPITTGQGGLSTGVVAGIGVGAALAGILLMAVVGWLWWTCVWKRRQRNTSILAPAVPGEGHDSEYIHGDSDKQELPSFGGPYYSNVRSELHGHGRTLSPVELAATESGRPGHAHYTY